MLDVPNKEGSFILESSTFQSGTSVATLADMNDMIFEGLVDESEVGKLKQGMELILNVGALEGKPFKATLEYIAPKGVTDQGTIKFTIRAAVTLDKELFLRSNYSANADIVLDKREDVLAINEGNLIIEDKTTFVEVETAPQKFEKREIKTGPVGWHQHRSGVGLSKPTRRSSIASPVSGPGPSRYMPRKRC